MSAKIEKIGDILKLVSHPDDVGPKRITLDLSEDGTFYYTRMYIDIVDRNNNQTYEGYIECKSAMPKFINNFDVLMDDTNEEIFTITIPNGDD